MNPPLLRILRSEEIGPRRGSAVDEPTLATARDILDNISNYGDAAALAHARRLGDLREGERHLYGPAELRAALDRVPPADRGVLERSAERIGAFARAQRACLRDLAFPIRGGEAGHSCIPVESAGCYAPGGRFPLPSSVLMTAVTARAAGVKRVWVASPRPTDATLGAAAIAGADGLLAIGGAQAIACLARGMLGVPACDMIVGPGNRWVTAAKLLVSGEVGIDMLAGPSELAILADETADPRLVAADLLAQAEHDDDAIPILITTAPDLIGKVEQALRDQLQSLPTAATAKAALRNGFAVMAESIQEAVDVCDRIGPEHLEIQTRDAAAIAKLVRNTGAVFVGSASAEVLGDYGAGPNHVLPTGGTSRHRAGLSVLDFLRVRTWLRVDDPVQASAFTEDAVALARMEQLEGHARSAESRSREPGTRGAMSPDKFSSQMNETAHSTRAANNAKENRWRS